MWSVVSLGVLLGLASHKQQGNLLHFLLMFVQATPLSWQDRIHCASFLDLGVFGDGVDTRERQKRQTQTQQCWFVLCKQLVHFAKQKGLDCCTFCCVKKMKAQDPLSFMTWPLNWPCTNNHSWAKEETATSVLSEQQRQNWFFVADVCIVMFAVHLRKCSTKWSVTTHSKETTQSELVWSVVVLEAREKPLPKWTKDRMRCVHMIVAVIMLSTAKIEVSTSTEKCSGQVKWQHTVTSEMAGGGASFWILDTWHLFF